MRTKLSWRRFSGSRTVTTRFQEVFRFTLLVAVLSVPATSSALAVGDPLQPGKLEQEINDAYRSGARTITINPGKYVMPAKPGGASLSFRQMKDVIISANQVEFSFVDPKDALGFYGCANLTFGGAAIHYDHPRFCQAKILGFGTDPAKGAYYDVQIDLGYPRNARFKSAYVFDPTQRKIKLRTGDMSARSVEALDETGKVRVFWGNPRVSPPAYNVQEGDYLVCRGDGGTLLHADRCEGCTFRDLALYWGGVFGIFETGPSRGNHYLAISLTCGPVPPGATNAPFISQSADGLHSAGARVGPDIERCTFESMCDDAFAIHGYFVDIVAVSGKNLTVKKSSFEVGDVARISSAKGFSDEAKVQSVSRLPDGAWLVTLDHEMEAQAGYKVGNPSASVAGKIVNNTIRNNRARGILAKGDDGLIEANLIDGSTMSGISIGPEYDWNEADYCHNVEVRNNVVRNTDYAANGQGENGAVLIHGDGAKGNRNILIENNRLESVLGPNLIVEWADGVKIAGNTFDLAQRLPQGNKQRDQAAIWLRHVRDVSFTGNVVKGRADINSDLFVLMGEDVTGLSGASMGVVR